MTWNAQARRDVDGRLSDWLCDRKITTSHAGEHIGHRRREVRAGVRKLMTQESAVHGLVLALNDLQEQVVDPVRNCRRLGAEGWQRLVVTYDFVDRCCDHLRHSHDRDEDRPSDGRTGEPREHLAYRRLGFSEIEPSLSESIAPGRAQDHQSRRIAKQLRGGRPVTSPEFEFAASQTAPTLKKREVSGCQARYRRVGVNAETEIRSGRAQEVVQRVPGADEWIDHRGDRVSVSGKGRCDGLREEARLRVPGRLDRRTATDANTERIPGHGRKSEKPDIVGIARQAPSRFARLAERKPTRGKRRAEVLLPDPQILGKRARLRSVDQRR